uniref:hypothetical protein n=1 Tax=uncultured Methylobacterium sp. TaxID=157278 RepID=UPI0035CAA3ED
MRLLASESAFQGSHRVPLAIRRPGRSGRHRSAGRFDGALRVALRHQVEDAPLVPGDGLVALGQVRLKLAQAADVGAVRLTDEVREHVHLAEDVLHQRPVGRRMGDRRPVGAGDLAALQIIAPERTDLARGAGLREALDLALVAAVQRLLQQLAPAVPAPGHLDDLAVQAVLGH